MKLYGVVLESSVATASIAVHQSNGGEGSYGTNAQLSIVSTHITTTKSQPGINVKCWVTTNKEYISQRMVKLLSFASELCSWQFFATHYS